MNRFRKAALGALAAVGIIAAGLGVASASTPHISPISGAAPASNYIAVNPDRVLDTRNGVGVAGHSPLAKGGVVKVQVAGANGVPATANSVTLNVTEASNSAGGYLTVYPDGTDRGLASTLNFLTGSGSLANEVTVKLGDDGAVDVYNLAGTTDVVADLEGYTTPVVTPAATTFGVGQFQVNGTTWASYSAPELGAPGGDQAAGTVRFSCKDATNGCDVSLKAYSTASGETVYPRIVLEKESNTNGAKFTCEYADGADNNGATQALTDTATTVNMGIGSTADCGSTVQTTAGTVDHINVPGEAGQGVHYDAFVTLTFARSAA